MPQRKPGKQKNRPGILRQAQDVQVRDVRAQDAQDRRLSDSRIRGLICLVLVLVTIVVYWQVVGFAFINYDDDLYVQTNQNVLAGLTLHSLQWAFSTTYQSNWHPLTWISLMADADIGKYASLLLGLGSGGTAPGVYHLTNLVGHIANVLLLFVILNQMTGLKWRSAFVAVLFAIHPLHVESVAWIAERKDILSTMFWLLTIWAYIRYAKAPCKKNYGLVVIGFVLGLLSKPMLVSLPLILLLLDIWPLRRCGALRGLILEKVPLAVLAGLSCAVTFYAQKAGGALRSLQEFPLGVRMANAAVAYVSYIGKTLWPHNLFAPYPHPGAALSAWLVAASIALLLSLTTLAIAARRRRPYLTVGWLWYLVTLVPVIGLVQVGRQAMADRYTYIPIIGLFVIIAWGIPELVQARVKREGSTQVAFLAAPAVLVVAVLMTLAFGQARYWRDSTALFEHALAINPRNSLALDNLAVAMGEKGDVEQAVSDYRAALRIDPANVDIHREFCIFLLKHGRRSEAIAEVVQVLRYDPADSAARAFLDNYLRSTGKRPEASRK